MHGAIKLSVIYLSILVAVGVLRPFAFAEIVPPIREIDAQIKYLVDRQKRSEALKWVVQLVASSQGMDRATLIRKAHILGCTFMTNRTFQIYQEGQTFLLNKKYKLAKDKFEKALSEEPDNIEILTRLGQSSLLDADLEGAKDRLIFANSLNPYEPQVKLWLGRAMLQQGSDKAVAELRAAYSELKESEQAVVWLAEALGTFGQMGSAVRLLNADIKKWPFHVWSMMMLAKAQSEITSENQKIQNLGAARKTLHLALSRLEQYPYNASLGQGIPELKDNLSFDVRKSSAELKNEIQKYLSQIQSKLGESASSASKKRSL